MKKQAVKIVLMGLAAVVLIGCGRRDEVKLARQVVTQLAQGRYAVRKLIDWPGFIAFEQPIGEDYKTLPNDKEKEDYQRAFVDSFKKGFQEQKGNLNAFYDWRVFSKKDPNFTIVAANLHNDKIVLLIGIKHERGRSRVTQLKLLQVFDQDKFEEYEQEMAR